MVNSATQALAEFKSQRMGNLLSGNGGTVTAPTIANTSIVDTASDRLARSMPRKSTTQFMDGLRKRGSTYHQQALQNMQNRQQQVTGVAGASARPGDARSGYQLPSGGKPQTGGPRGQYGITVAAGQALKQLQAAYSQAGMGNLTVNSGGRTYQDQAKLYALYKAGKGNRAAPPGTSLHESGIAVDFGGPLYNTNMNAAMSTKQHAWMRQNAAKFKWFWVGKNFGESWHWEYHPEWN